MLDKQKGSPLRAELLTLNLILWKTHCKDKVFVWSNQILSDIFNKKIKNLSFLVALWKKNIIFAVDTVRCHRHWVNSHSFPRKAESPIHINTTGRRTAKAHVPIHRGTWAMVVQKLYRLWRALLFFMFLPCPTRVWMVVILILSDEKLNCLMLNYYYYGTSY